MPAGFLVLADFVTAVIAKKAWLFTQFRSILSGGLCLAFRSLIFGDTVSFGNVSFGDAISFGDTIRLGSVSFRRRRVRFGDIILFGDDAPFGNGGLILVGDIKTGTFENYSGAARHKPAYLFSAFRALLNWLIAHGLKDLETVIAFFTFIFIRGHGHTIAKTRKKVKIYHARSRAAIARGCWLPPE
jgi:hypothetical protein